MTPADVSVSSQCAKLISERIDAYEQQMSADHFADLRNFLRSLDEKQKSIVLVELVKVDLERQWRSGRQRKLEDYFQEYPELGDPSSPTLDLIQEEYKVRCRWGDAPARDGYYRRFQVDRSQLDKALSEIDGSIRVPATTLPYAQDRTPADDAAALADTSAYSSHDTAHIQPPSGTPSAAAAEAATSDISPILLRALREGPLDKRAARDTHPAPANIGRYRVEQELGAGGFGRVYRCRDDELHRTVAIKLPHGWNAASTVRADEIIREARSAARLRHPGIVATLDTLRCDDGRIAIVNEFVEGQSLRTHLRQKDFTRAEAIDWIAGIADALAYAHKHQVVHRDVKPDNILVDAERRPHLTDFGLATLDGEYEPDETGRILGTLGYMSPEQASGQSHWASPAADIYALGVMLYEILVGKLPFWSTKQIDFLDQIRHRPPPPLRASDDSITPALEAICLKALAKEPGARFTSAADMASALRDLSRPRVNRWPKLIGAAGLLLVIAGWIVFSIWHKPPVDVVDPTKVVNRQTPSAVAPAKSDLDPHLDIRFQRAAEQVGHHRLEEVDLPLGKGDKVQLHATLAKPGYVYLYWCDGQGKPKRLWPTDPTRIEAVTEIWDPPKSKTQWQTWHVVGGPPAAELALLAVSETPIPPTELERFESTVCQLPTVEAARTSLLTIAFPEIETDEITRSIDGKAITLLDPLPADFEQALRARFHAYVGLVVTHN